MLAKMNVDEQNGEDVSLRRKNLQEAIVAEIDKYGHPANNSEFYHPRPVFQNFRHVYECR